MTTNHTYVTAYRDIIKHPHILLRIAKKKIIGFLFYSIDEATLWRIARNTKLMAISQLIWVLSTPNRKDLLKTGNSAFAVF